MLPSWAASVFTFNCFPCASSRHSGQEPSPSQEEHVIQKFPGIPRIEIPEPDVTEEPSLEPERQPASQDSNLDRLPTPGRSRASSTTSSHKRRLSSHSESRPDASALWNALSKNERPPETMALTLAEKLRDQLIEWPLEQNHYFLPICVLDDLITEKTVKSELLELKLGVEERKLDSYVKEICSKAKKLFTLLLLQSQVRSIFALVDEDIGDKDLPFKRCYQRKIGVHPSTFTLCTKTHSPNDNVDHSKCGIKAIASWKGNTVKDFCAIQWQVLAPVFERNNPDMKDKSGHNTKIPHFDLDDNTVLPFVEDHEGKVVQTKVGGYSHVWGVRIHPAHQKVYRSTDPLVPVPLLAVKRPYSLDPVDFYKEKDMLSELQVRQHKHLVQLLATYKYKSHYHLIFPYANTNLRGYWMDTGLPHWNSETYLWFLRQVCGIASGLNAIHNFKTSVPLGSVDVNPMLKALSGRLTVAKAEERFGRHGDIKPENILWSNELEGTPREGVLQICDLGLGRFHRLETRSHVDPRHLSGSPTYAPPEVKLMELVSRSYDIWSLGCLYLEFISWLLEGGSAIGRFSTVRESTALDGIIDDTFYSIKRDETGKERAIIRQGVKDWIERLKQHERCSMMVNAILMLVQSDLLIINSGSRITAQNLDIKLRRILERAENDRTYLLGREPPILDPGAGVKIPKGTNTQYGESAFHASGPLADPHIDLPARDTIVDIPDIRIQEHTTPPADVASHKAATWPPNKPHSNKLGREDSHDSNGSINDGHIADVGYNHVYNTTVVMR